MAKSTQGSSGAFTYDFGIMISQATVGRLERVARNTLTLAGAYYALNRQATEYVSTLRKQQMFFGGQVSTMKAIADAQERIIQGTARFDVSDQLDGMNNLMRVGINARKEFEWTEKAAHAMGVSYSQFSNAIANGIRGNMGGLVEMGLITERATRMFDKYQGNTIMRQQAILNFVKQHKGLQTAIANDFGTIKDEVRRLTTVWKNFLQAVLGQPNDPGSFYGQVRYAIKEVADGFARSTIIIRRYAFQIGQILGWIVRQIGHVVTWLGSKVKQALQTLWRVGDNYQEAVRSVVVWLEFWKVRIVSFFKEYSDQIKTALKWTAILMVSFKALKVLFGTGLGKIFLEDLEFCLNSGKGLFTSFFTAIRSMFLVGSGRILNPIGKVFGTIAKWSGLLIKGIVSGIRVIGAAFTTSNPIGWIILAIGVVIGLLVVLYKKCEPFRTFVNNLGKAIVQYYRLIWNSLMWAYVQIRIGATKAWNWLKRTYVSVKNAFGKLGQWVSKIWDAFMNTKVGAWLNQHIFSPISRFVNWISDAFKRLFGWIGRTVKNIGQWLGIGADKVGQAAADAAAEHGFSVPVWNDPFQNSGSNNNRSTDNTPTATLPSSGTPAFAGSGGSNTTSMNFSQGSIQIILNGADGIDENKLAGKIREVIRDIQRDGTIRGGRA